MYCVMKVLQKNQEINNILLKKRNPRAFKLKRQILKSGSAKSCHWWLWAGQIPTSKSDIRLEAELICELDSYIQPNCLVRWGGMTTFAPTFLSYQNNSFITWCFSDRASWIYYILITNLIHWLLFIHKILFSSTCFEPQVLIFRRIQLYTCSIWYCHSVNRWVVEYYLNMILQIMFK